jgi:hypothetical protein
MRVAIDFSKSSIWSATTYSFALCDLVEDIPYRTEVSGEEREAIQDEGREGDEAMVLDLGEFLDCFGGGLPEVQVWSITIEVEHVGEGFAEEIMDGRQFLQLVEPNFDASAGGMRCPGGLIAVLPNGEEVDH